MYGVEVSLWGGLATLLQDPNQKGGSTKPLCPERQRLRDRGTERPFPGLLTTLAPGLPVTSSGDLRRLDLGGTV